MPVGAVLPAIIAGGATLIAGRNASRAADRASQVQSDASQRAADVQLQMYETTREDLKPYMEHGVPAMNSLAAMYGLVPGSEAFGEKQMEAFRAAPDYQIAMREGLSALDKSAASRGMLKSGRTMKGAMDYASDLGTRKLDSYLNRLRDIAGIGQSSAARTGAAALSTGSNLANTYLGQGQAEASGIIGSSNAQNRMITGLGDSLIYAMSRNPSAYAHQDPRIY
jgi:hypothetical protein